MNCHETLAVVRYHKNAIKYIPKSRGISILLHSFDLKKGDSFKVLEELCKAKFKLIKVVSQWSDDNHTFTDKHYRAAIKDAKQCSKIFAKYPNIEFQFTPFLEHREYSYLKLDGLFTSCRKPLGDKVVLINNPLRGGVYLDTSINLYNEIHHYDFPTGEKGNYQFSSDGVSSFDDNFQRQKETHKKAQHIWGWCLQYNLLKNDEDRTNRKDRKIMPVGLLIKSMDYILQNDKGATSLDGTLYTLKSHAEQEKNSPDISDRDNKPVFISKPKVNNIKFVDYKGNSIDVEDSGKLEDGRFVYRLKPRGGKYGFNYSKKAMKKTGATVYKVLKGTTVIGIVDLAFREGTFRK